MITEFESATLKFLPWWEAFTAGRTLLEELDGIKHRVDGALLLFAPESTTIVRRKKQAIPNLNVLFEFGYFYGHFGHDKVAVLKFGEFYLPSDLGGYVHIFGSKGFTRSSARRINERTRTELNRWLVRL
ncbi:MAG: hypothetical protein JWR16_3330 [Nevskia sp.]|nr:hypothetical protein [Nevskia sp.]